MKHNTIYLILIALVTAAFVVVFDMFPRTRISELEKRELTKFPVFSWQRLWSGEFTSGVSAWFSDSEPFRDQLMTLSMQFSHLMGIELGEENVRISLPQESSSCETPADSLAPSAGDEVAQPTDDPNFTLEENAKIANAGIIIVGSGANVRALMAFGGDAKGGKGYADVANLYQQTFAADGVQVYCMAIPTAIEYYCPERVQSRTKSQLAVTEHIFSCLDPQVKSVDVYYALRRHRSEDIYLRTDHHWSPLGGYYAAEAFARVAGVPFRDLTHYDRRVVHGYVGSMYGYSKDIAVKKAPEDFVYYVPTEVEYETTYINYQIDEHYQVTAEGRPVRSQYFFHYKDGNGGAYCTMMGGDNKITQVRTKTPSHRRLLVLKDSFGNMLPSYLFYSFEEVHVVDARYFTKDMVEYVRDNKITDILFANNIFSAYSHATTNAYRRFLHQRWTPPSTKPKETEKASEPQADDTQENGLKEDSTKREN